MTLGTFKSGSSLPVQNWVMVSSSLSPDYVSSSDRHGRKHSRVLSFQVLTKQLTATTTQGVQDKGLPAEKKDDQGVSRTVQTTLTDVIYELSMHVPPEEMVTNYAQHISRNKTRGSWALERWGEELVSLEVRGSSGIFFRNGEGISRKNAAGTYAYGEVMELMQIYRNNGMSLDPQFGVIDTIGEVVLRYDGKLHRGSFDNFTLVENEDMPYRFTYSFTFVVRGEGINAKTEGHFVGHPISPAASESGSQLFPASARRSSNLTTTKRKSSDTSAQSGTTQDKASGKGYEEGTSREVQTQPVLQEPNKPASLPNTTEALVKSWGGVATSSTGISLDAALSRGDILKNSKELAVQRAARNIAKQARRTPSLTPKLSSPPRSGSYVHHNNYRAPEGNLN